MTKTTSILLGLLFFFIGAAAQSNNINPNFRDAITQGDVASVRHHIAKNPSLINTKWHNGWMPLHVAASNEQAAVAKLLIENGADINAQPAGDFYGTPLHIAASSGNVAIVQMLIAAGADVNALNGYKDSAMTKAEEYGHKEVIELLIAAGANVPQNYQHGISALHDAIRQNNTADVLALIADGADINAQTSGTKLTPLMVAIHKGATELAKALIEAGADLQLTNSEGQNALHLAAFYNNIDIVELLLDKGMDANPKTTRVAVTDAAELKEMGVSTYGNSIDKLTVTVEVASPLSQAIYGDNVEVAKLLIAQGADFLSPDKTSGQTMLHQAALLNAPKITQLLIESGADINALTVPLGHTPLDIAEKRQNHQVANIIREHGGDNAGYFAKLKGWITFFYDTWHSVKEIANESEQDNI